MGGRSPTAEEQSGEGADSFGKLEVVRCADFLLHSRTTEMGEQSQSSSVRSRTALRERSHGSHTLTPCMRGDVVFWLPPRRTPGVVRYRCRWCQGGGSFLMPCPR